MLDKNTGLVWEQAPSETFRFWEKVSPPDPEGATNHCINSAARRHARVEAALVAELECKGSDAGSAVCPGERIYHWHRCQRQYSRRLCEQLFVGVDVFGCSYPRYRGVVRGLRHSQHVPLR